MTIPNDCPMTPEQRLKSTLLVTQLVAGCFMVSVAIFLGVAWLMLQQQQGSDPANFDSVVLYALAGIAAVLLFSADAIANTFRRAARAKMDQDKENITPVVTFFTLSVIVGSALREGTAMIGLVLSIISQDINWCLGFGALALVFMALRFPRKADLEKLLPELRSRT